jgi:molybdopterin/thiamine biosynthesis adenylyltransferase
MLASPTGRSPDVQQLVAEGYAVAIDGDYIIVDNVPYVTQARAVQRAAIISPYYEKDGVADVKGDHAVWFTGSVPHTAKGESLANAMVANTNPAVIAGRQVLCQLSYKSERPETLKDFHTKLTHYIRKFQSYAQEIEPGVSASNKGKGSISVRQHRSVFIYSNDAVARSGLDAYQNKLKLPKVAIVGLGGTGSYILDALAKTPVEEIHVYDDDIVEPATAFRMPGAPTYEEAHGKLQKTNYLREVYSRLRTGIESHPVRVDQTNVAELNNCAFVFIAIDDGLSRGLIARHLAEKNIPFIDTGIGVDKLAEEVKLFGRVRVSAIDAGKSSLVDKLPTADDREEEVYNNIQLAELNALNAMLAVIVYKQRLGFYANEEPFDTLRYNISWQSILRVGDPPVPS